MGRVLLREPKRRMYLTEKLSFSSSDVSSSVVVSSGIPLRTTLRVRSSGRLNV